MLRTGVPRTDRLSLIIVSVFLRYFLRSVQYGEKTSYETLPRVRGVSFQVPGRVSGYPGPVGYQEQVGGRRGDVGVAGVKVCVVGSRADGGLGT